MTSRQDLPPDPDDQSKAAASKAEANESVPSTEDMRALIRQRVAEQRQERERANASLPQDLVLWLALAPKWTDDLITQVARRRLSEAWSPSDTAQFVEQLEEQGWLQRQVAPRLRHRPTTPDLLTLSAEAAGRQRGARRRDGEGRRPMATHIFELGQTLVEIADEKDITVPESTQRWAQLASRADSRGGLLTKAMGSGPEVTSWEPVAEFLEERVEALPTGVALRWIEAAQPLSAVLARDLETRLDLAIRRSALRLELRDRRRHDLKHLESFLERPDQIDILRRVILERDDPGSPWALHLLGGGGVGKTMLVRHLTARLASVEHWNFSVARVDFDFLNPDYPRLAPGLLLWAFAQELRVFDSTGRAGQAFDDSHRILRQLHDLLKAGETTIRATDHRLFQYGIEIYGQALEQLPQPVVLIIDTCEELTKPRAGVDSQFNVDETFRILEALHQRVESLKVVFAGRRPLAGGGFGWQCPPCQLPPRPYLGLFEVRGFSLDEARTYLARAGVPQPLIEPVVTRSSPDTGGVADIQWLLDQGPEEMVRCNPYELRFFAEWACDEPPPQPADIEHAGGERYVKLRILERLKSPRVADILPVLALAKHLDEELLRQLSGLDGSAFTEFLEDLQEQEWIERRAASSQEGFRNILAVEEGLRLRLQSYYVGHPSNLEDQRRRAVEIFRRRTLEDDPAHLDVTDLDAAVRVMAQADGSDLWWRRVEERLFAERDADWLGQQAAYLVGPEGAAALPDEASWPELRTVHPLRPAILATLALAESRHPGGGLTPWMEVAESADGLPTIGADLTLRAKAMELACRRAIGWDVGSQDAWALWQRVANFDGVPTEETMAALVAAAEAAVEQFEERHPEPGASELVMLSPVAARPGGQMATRLLVGHLEGWNAPKRLRAMHRGLDARVFAGYPGSGDGTSLDAAVVGTALHDAVNSFHEAIRLAKDSTGGPWLAWRAPRDLATRLRLEAMRALYPTPLSPALCFDKFASLNGDAEGIERDRFLAMVAELALAEGVTSKAFPIVRQAEVDEPTFTPRCLAHVELPPLQVQVARLAAVEGRFDEAFASLDEISRRADDFPGVVVRHAARVALDLAIRLRHLEGQPGQPLESSDDIADQHLLELSMLYGRRVIPEVAQSSPEDDPRRLGHLRWQTLVEPDAGACREAFLLATHLVQEDDDRLDSLDLHLMLDGLEAGCLDAFVPDSTTDDSSAAGSFPLGRLSEKVLRVTEDRRDPLTAWNLYLRQWALERFLTVRFDHPDVSTTVDETGAQLVQQLGARRAGIVAWRRADYLALRLPTAAANLFAVARHLLAEAGDQPGEAICLTAQCCCLANAESGAAASWKEPLSTAWRRLGVDFESDPQGSFDRLFPELLPDFPPELSPVLEVWWTRTVALALLASDEASVRRQVQQIPPRYLGEPREPMLAWIDSLEERPKFSRSDTGVGIPAPSAPPHHSASPQMKDTPPSRPPRRALETRGIGLAIGLATAIAIVILIGVPFALRAVGSFVGIDLNLRTWGILATCVALLGGPWILSRSSLSLFIMRRWRRFDFTIGYSVPEGSGGKGQIDFTGHEVQRRWRFGLWPWWKELRRALPPVHIDPIEDPSRTAYAEQLREQQPFAEADFGTSPPLVYLTNPFRPELAWEGFLAGALGPKARHFQRVRSVLASTAQPRKIPPDPTQLNAALEPAPWPVLDEAVEASAGVLILTESKLAIDAALHGWRSLPEFDIDLTHLSSRELATNFGRTQPRPVFSQRVVHLVGEVVETSAGRRFRISEPSSKHLDLRAEDLPTFFLEASLVILQETPVGLMNPRSAADRRQANDLRGFADEVHQAGIAAVLTLPHMLAERAAECTERLARLLRRRHRLADLFGGEKAVPIDPALLDTVDAIRRVLRDEPDHDDEAAWDVVLFAPMGWRNPFRRSGKNSPIEKRAS